MYQYLNIVCCYFNSFDNRVRKKSRLGDRFTLFQRPSCSVASPRRAVFFNLLLCIIDFLIKGCFFLPFLLFLRIALKKAVFALGFKNRSALTLLRSFEKCCLSQKLFVTRLSVDNRVKVRTR